MDTSLRRPGGELASRPLHFIWITDCSGSMIANGKIQALNDAIRESVPLMRNVAQDNPNAQVLIRVLKFSTGAHWHIDEPVPIEQFEWTDLAAAGLTDLGKALSLVAEQMMVSAMHQRALPPVLVLVSDGQPTDNYLNGLQELMDLPWGKKAVRIGIAIGTDANETVLEKFIGNPEIPVLRANNPDVLTRYIKWASTVVLKSASSPGSRAQVGMINGGNVEIPMLPTVPTTALDVW
ncbi:MAG TPA: VWA domain-containing protein [Patescibacteria group bacterium]|nr:VWA domain-containing protein [Patescibacteria group bacterium]